MRNDLMGKALAARRAVMALCSAVEQQAIDQEAALGIASAADAIALRDQLIADLMQALGLILQAEPTMREEAITEARHTLDNVRDALPKAGE